MNWGIVTPTEVYFLELRDQFNSLYSLRSCTGRGQYLSAPPLPPKTLTSCLRGPRILALSPTQGNNEVFRIMPSPCGSGYTVQTYSGAFVSILTPVLGGRSSLSITEPSCGAAPMAFKVITEPILGATCIPFALRALDGRKVALWGPNAWLTLHPPRDGKPTLDALGGKGEVRENERES